MMLQLQLSFYSQFCWVKGKAVLTHLTCSPIFPPPCPLCSSPFAFLYLSPFLLQIFSASFSPPYSFPHHITFSLPLRQCMSLAFLENHLYSAVCSDLPPNTFLLPTPPKFAPQFAPKGQIGSLWLFLSCAGRKESTR